MDTATHTAMGLGLYGLAHLDPVVASHPETAQAVLLATVIGSQAPDFDGLSRFRGSAAYIRNHRGITHSLPMLLAWPLLITGTLSLFYDSIHLRPLLLWGFVAVAVHIFIDLFNSYGTQVLRPFSKRWVKWHVLNIFDPFIMGVHLIGFALWSFTPLPPGPLFAGIYAMIVLYIGWRWLMRKRTVKQVRQAVGSGGKLTLIPTVRWNAWRVVWEDDTLIRTGEIHGNRIRWNREFPKDQTDHPAVRASRQAPTVDAFLYFTEYAHPLVTQRHYGYEVRWVDVRYHYKKHFPFTAYTLLDKDLQILQSDVGWISEDQLQKRTRSLSLET